MAAAKSAAAASKAVAAVHITVKGPDPVNVGAHRFAGESIVPVSAYTAAELKAIREHAGLTVVDTETAVEG